MGPFSAKLLSPLILFFGPSYVVSTLKAKVILTPFLRKIGTVYNIAKLKHVIGA